MALPQADAGPVKATDYLEGHVNCRCTLVPRPKSYAEITGDQSLPDHRPPITSGADAFAKLPSELQRSILGPGKYDLYRQGVPLEAMVRRLESSSWGASRVAKSLRQLQEELQISGWTPGASLNGEAIARIVAEQNRTRVPVKQPDDFTTPAEAEEWFRQRFPNSKLGILNEVDIRYLNSTMKALDNLGRQFPEAMDFIKQVNFRDFKEHPQTMWRSNAYAHVASLNAIPGYETAGWLDKAMEFNTKWYGPAGRVPLTTGQRQHYIDQGRRAGEYLESWAKNRGLNFDKIINMSDDEFADLMKTVKVDQYSDALEYKRLLTASQIAARTGFVPPPVTLTAAQKAKLQTAITGQEAMIKRQLESLMGLVTGGPVGEFRFNTLMEIARAEVIGQRPTGATSIFLRQVWNLDMPQSFRLADYARDLARAENELHPMAVERFTNALRSDIASGFHPTIGDESNDRLIQSVAVHEFGHVVDHWMSLGYGKTQWVVGSLGNQGWGAITSIWDDFTKHIKPNSLYGKKNQAEKFAELFMEAYHAKAITNKNAGRIAKMFAWVKAQPKRDMDHLNMPGYGSAESKAARREMLIKQDELNKLLGFNLYKLDRDDMDFIHGVGAYGNP